MFKFKSTIIFLNLNLPVPVSMGLNKCGRGILVDRGSWAQIHWAFSTELIIRIWQNKYKCVYYSIHVRSELRALSNSLIQIHVGVLLTPNIYIAECADCMTKTVSSFQTAHRHHTSSALNWLCSQHASCLSHVANTQQSVYACRSPCTGMSKVSLWLAGCLLDSTPGMLWWRSMC